MMSGMPKFRKESHPERARDKRRLIFSHLLGGLYIPCAIVISAFLSHVSEAGDHLPFLLQLLQEDLSH
jgi:hypothetical protein